MLRRVDGERRATGGAGRRGGARQPVRHRVEERAQQPLGFGQQHRLRGPVERYRMGQRRHRGGELPDPRLIVGRQRTGPPGVVIGDRQPGQQQTPGSELQREESSGAPERGGAGSMLRGPCAREYGQRVADREQQRRYGVHPRVGADDGQLLDGTGSIGGTATVRIPESHTAGTEGIRGQEDHGAAGECGDLGERCRRKPVHSDAEFLKFD